MASDVLAAVVGGPVLVDTSVWIDHLRGNHAAHVAALRALLARSGAVATAPPILQEILQGATTPGNFAALRARFMAIRCVAPADNVGAAVESARLFLECRMRGRTPRSSNDCLIASIAIEYDLTLLANDRDFDAIALVEPRLRLFHGRSAMR